MAYAIIASKPSGTEILRRIDIDIPAPSETDVVARVMDLTNSQGVAAVSDSVGKDTIMGFLDCLKLSGPLSI